MTRLSVNHLCVVYLVCLRSLYLARSTNRTYLRVPLFIPPPPLPPVPSARYVSDRQTLIVLVTLKDYGLQHRNIMFFDSMYYLRGNIKRPLIHACLCMAASVLRLTQSLNQESILSSAWFGGKSRLEQMVERQQAALQALTITHTEKMARLKYQYIV